MKIDQSHVDFKDEAGFGLVEVIVALVLFGIVAVGFIPFMINSLKSVDRDMTISSASQIVNERLNLAKNAGGQSCDAFKAAVGDNVGASTTNLIDGGVLEDGRGLPLTATFTLSDLDGSVLNPASFDCKPYMQVSIRVSGKLRGQVADYTYARASAYVRIEGVEGTTP